MSRPSCWWMALGLMLCGAAEAEPFDAAPFGLAQPDAGQIVWEDPREIHRVVIHFRDAAPSPSAVHLEYWGSWWPERHLPKDREPGGGDVGWMELGNWWKGGWRRADTDARLEGKEISFSFRPVNRSEFPQLTEYSAEFRYTLKLRVVADGPLPEIDRIEAFTDSILVPRSFRLVTDADPVASVVEVFNGRMLELGGDLVRVLGVANPDPNSFDGTLVTVERGGPRFTFRLDDLERGPLWVPHLAVAVLPSDDLRDYQAVAAGLVARGDKTLYDRVAELPEQTWESAWGGLPAKKSRIYFPLGLDGGRQRFRLNADGSVAWRSNDAYLRGRPGRDTPRLDWEASDVSLDWGLPGEPVDRTLLEESLPICVTRWEVDGVQVTQTALVTSLEGMRSDGPAPAGDAFAVFLARLTVTNGTASVRELGGSLKLLAGGRPVAWRLAGGTLWVGDRVRAGWLANPLDAATFADPSWRVRLAPGESRSFVLKLPYVMLEGSKEAQALAGLDFDRETRAVAGYWRRRLDESARLITPEPMLNEFYRSQAMHLLVNCEREPGNDRRFARVGSFTYGAYGNESCMMVLDLERRGYHREAQACLDAWLHYQGTVALPGSFAGQEGVLYGAGGYEAGGYNQHHGWILWMLAEHYRYTRDTAWLRQSASGLVAGADWVIRETARTEERPPLERGLLPAGSLEDIGDWWTWLSTSCYTWRGLDNAAWALGQIGHPEAPRIREAAEAYRDALLTNFRRASERSPVVRLRDGTAVPQFPSHVERRGRSFGWICQTLEGALHLLITRVIDPSSPEADWIVKDYEDNLYLSNQYGYLVEDEHWFGRGGMSMQACLLLDVEPYLYRDDVKHALRALFNGQAVSYFPDVRLNTEHALPEMGDWRGDHFKSSDESNAAGWLRYLFVREEDAETLLVGQAIPRDWLQAGLRCGMERTSTWFGPVSVSYTGGTGELRAELRGPTRNPPREIRLRFRHPESRELSAVEVNGQPWRRFEGEWVTLPGDVGEASVIGRF